MYFILNSTAHVCSKWPWQIESNSNERARLSTQLREENAFTKDFWHCRSWSACPYPTGSFFGETLKIHVISIHLQNYSSTTFHHLQQCNKHRTVQPTTFITVKPTPIELPKKMLGKSTCFHDSPSGGLPLQKKYWEKNNYSESNGLQMDLTNNLLKILETQTLSNSRY